MGLVLCWKKTVFPRADDYLNFTSPHWPVSIILGALKKRIFHLKAFVFFGKLVVKISRNCLF